MTALIAANFVPLLFAGLFCFLLTGIPVAFGLAATGLLFGFIGMELGLFSTNLFQALPLRVFNIMSNETLLAIPFFTFMGIILERSRMAEDLLETVGQVFGPVRGGLAIAVILVGALLAATTGVVAAAVISMGLISLPIMLRYGYNRTIATGTITASGTLAQAIPPSLVLIVLADQMGRSVGDMYAGALLPGLLLVGLYLTFILVVALVKPAWYGQLAGDVSALTPRHPLDIAGGLQCPVLGLYAGDDAGIAPDTVRRMQAALAAGGAASRASQIVVYPDAPHAFHADYRPSYRKQAAEDGWRRCLNWLRSHGVAP